MTFEERLDALERIVVRLNAESVSLTEALALFEEGVAQLRAASEELGRVDARVQQLVEGENGTFSLADFRV